MVKSILEKRTLYIYTIQIHIQSKQFMTLVDGKLSYFFFFFHSIVDEVCYL